MKIGGTGSYNLTGAGQPEETKRVDEATPRASISATLAAPAPALQSEVLASAAKALENMPEIDHAKVMALRDALARGEVPFNPARLAALIESHHGQRE